MTSPKCTILCTFVRITKGRQLLFTIRVLKAFLASIQSLESHSITQSNLISERVQPTKPINVLPTMLKARQLFRRRRNSNLLLLVQQVGVPLVQQAAPEPKPENDTNQIASDGEKKDDSEGPQPVQDSNQ